MGLALEKLPDWPAMMKRDTAARYCDMSTAEFERAIADGVIPMPIRFGDRERWSRAVLDRYISNATGESAPDWRAESGLYATGAFNASR